MIYRDKISTGIKSSRGALGRYESIRRSILAIRRHLLRGNEEPKAFVSSTRRARPLLATHAGDADALYAPCTFRSASIFFKLDLAFLEYCKNRTKK